MTRTELMLKWSKEEAEKAIKWAEVHGCPAPTERDCKVFSEAYIRGWFDCYATMKLHGWVKGDK